MPFKIDLDICGESVECDAVIMSCESGYMGLYVESLAGGESGQCLDDLPWYDHVNKLIIDAYLQSVGEWYGKVY